MYRVVWEVEIEERSPRAAAEKSLALLRNPESSETVFIVVDGSGRMTRVDLTKAEDTDVRV